MHGPRQPYFPLLAGLGVRDFGGSLLKGNPRDARPLAAKRPIHVVMRSSLACGPLSLLSPVRAKRIEATVRGLAKAKGIRLYRYANAGNHLHLLVLAPTRPAFKAYLRALTGIVARITLSAQRGSAQGKKFWDARPFTRIVEWGRDFRGVAGYLLRNTLEAIGFIPYQPRGRRTARAGPGDSIY
jgi:REP element-mobilizing transposase RayT